MVVFQCVLYTFGKLFDNLANSNRIRIELKSNFELLFKNSFRNFSETNFELHNNRIELKTNYFRIIFKFKKKTD